MLSVLILIVWDTECIGEACGLCEIWETVSYIIGVVYMFYMYLEDAY